MNNKGAFIFPFIIGAAIGSGITWIYAKKKYEEIIEKEVSSARETYNQLGKDLIEKNNKMKEAIFKKFDEELQEDLNEYIDEVEVSGYVSTEEEMPEHEEEIPLPAPSSNPYIPYEISGDEYGSDENYNLISLTYYSDGTLLDDAEEFVDDAVDILGDDIFKKLARYDEQGVSQIYVRNDTRRCDYEILLMGFSFN